jgi:hypothetical protein
VNKISSLFASTTLCQDNSNDNYHFFNTRIPNSSLKGRGKSSNKMLTINSKSDIKWLIKLDPNQISLTRVPQRASKKRVARLRAKQVLAGWNNSDWGRVRTRTSFHFARSAFNDIFSISGLSVLENCLYYTGVRIRELSVLEKCPY